MIQGEWKRSSTCESASCVEVMPTSDKVIVRNSNAGHQIVVFTKEEWDAFIAGAKLGDFDLDS